MGVIETQVIETQRPARAPGADTALRDWVRALEATAPIAAHPQRLLPCVIGELARTHPDAPALLSESENLSYGALARRIDLFARWALGTGIAKGDTVALLMPNCPEYLAIWLGLTSAGVVVALINTGLRGASLTHCLDIAKPKHVIVDGTLCPAFREVEAKLTGRPKVWSHGAAPDDGYDRIDLAVEQFPAGPLTVERRLVTIEDVALLIYTSGTTGLPKAARVSHRRLLQWSFWFAGLMNTGPQDRMYDCLPLYHSVGGVVATGALLVRGGSVLIRDKFSVQHFWDDVADGGCTLFQYIGELARYLVNAPDHPRQRTHRLRVCCGNGLRADVWEKFRQKFAIPRILEFYASTEGNFSLYNVEGRVGAVGRVPPFLAHRFPLAVVKFDAMTGEPARDPDGFCMRCAVDETGEAIGLIANGPSPSGGEFEGYTDPQASEKKILRNAFAPGDAWYRTGDLMRRDAAGFFYFTDRTGDTFRWKGENVATSEVEAVIASFPGIREASVYGVHVPGTEGAAGMAAIVAGTLDLEEFHRYLTRSLPRFARPLFLRITDRLATTSTFKQTSADLKREGFDPAAGDPVWLNDPAKGAFVRLDPALFARIQAGSIRL